MCGAFRFFSYRSFPGRFQIEKEAVRGDSLLFEEFSYENVYYKKGNKLCRRMGFLLLLKSISDKYDKYVSKFKKKQKKYKDFLKEL